MAAAVFDRPQPSVGNFVDRDALIIQGNLALLQEVVDDLANVGAVKVGLSRLGIWNREQRGGRYPLTNGRFRTATWFCERLIVEREQIAPDI